MSTRLFVDCDDTLILYDVKVFGNDPHPFGVLAGESFRINNPLVESIKAYVYDNPCALVVIWSGGGAQYARTIADIVLPGVEVATLIKDHTTFSLVRTGDIVIDDMDLEVSAKVLRPDWVYVGNIKGV